MKRQTAPLSPHIQIYRPQLTSVLSISHRITGIALSIGSILLVAWLVAAAAGPYAFSVASTIVNSPGGSILLLLWTFSLFFHLCNGIRHLVWDAGLGFDLRTIYLSGWTVIVASAVLTGLAWLAGYIEDADRHDRVAAVADRTLLSHGARSPGSHRGLCPS